MQASHYFGEQGEGKVMTAPGDFTMTATKVTCPKNCISVTNGGMVVFGPAEQVDEFSARIYTLDSSICGAAVHAGIINEQEGGDILIHLSKGRDSFVGSMQNGIKSSNKGIEQAAFYFNNSPLPIALQCDDLANVKLKTDPGGRFNVSCPSKCFTQFKNKS
mmetsp:Transcript_71293/g.153817  ORF Transcript_71293/g.153817 Transcript_71293/m.153817 type:complete len:161 (-) Transcript_71293:1742-2224(-)